MVVDNAYLIFLNFQFEDLLWEGLTDQYIKTPMGITAEDLGAQYKITREQCDEFALLTQTRWRLGRNLSLTS